MQLFSYAASLLEFGEKREYLKTTDLHMRIHEITVVLRATLVHLKMCLKKIRDKLSTVNQFM